MKNHRLVMVTVYLFLMAFFLYIKPSIAFGREGNIRPFGVTEKDATIFPFWWWIFVIAVISYCITVWMAGFRIRH